MSEKRIYILNAADEILYCLNGVRYESVSYTDNLMEYDILTFDVDKYIDVDGECQLSSGYSYLKEMMYIYISDMDADYPVDNSATSLAKRRGRFRISDVQIDNDGYNESKTVSCESCECEMNNQNLVGFKINTGELDSAEYLADGNIDDATGLAKEYVVFYSSSNKQLSLLDLAIEKVPYWSIGYVDPLLRNKKFTFNVDSQPIYSFLMNEVSSTAQCLFMFNTIDRKINVYSIAKADELGDTNIFVGYRNLLNTVNVQKSGDGVYTRFNVAGSDNLSIASVNFNDSYLENLTHLLYDVDEDGNLIYANSDIQDKYNAWYEYRYGNSGHRQEFIDIAKQYNQSLIDISDLENRVPADALDYTQYDSFDEKTLNQLLNTYISIVNGMATDFAKKDSKGNIVTGSDGLAVITDMNGLKESIYWEDYQLYVNILIPNLETAIENLKLPADDKLPYIDTFETDWDLYGTVELNGKLNAYQQSIDTLADAGYSKAWNALSAAEKSKWVESNYNIYHAEYTKSQNQYDVCYIALKGSDKNGTVMYKDADGYYLQRTNGTQYYYDEDWNVTSISPKRNGTRLLGREVELANARSAQSALVQQRTDLAAAAAIENEQFGFTKEQLSTIYRLRRDTDYVNENILITSLDDVVSQLDSMEELFQAATDELDIESQPQYELSATLDNLFNIDVFQEYRGDFASGHFIRMILSDEEQIKLRVTKVTRNPCLDDDNTLEITFSNMIRDKNGLSDYTNLFQSAIQSSVNQITANYAKSFDFSQVYLSDNLIKAIANSHAVAEKVASIVADTVTAKDGIFDTVSSQYISTEEFEARLARVLELDASSAFVKYLNANYMVANAVDVDTLNARLANIDTLVANKADINFANVDIATITEGWIKDLMVQGKIVAKEGTIYYLDAIHVNADSIDAGTLTADRILLHGDDGLYYQINVDTLGNSVIEAMTETEQAKLKNTIHADAITAHTITTDHITVNNLQGTGGWINLANGTFEYRNATSGNGISWDGEHLSIKADSILFSNGVNAETAINGKNAVYYQSDAPSGDNYKANDLWFDTGNGNAMYAWDGSQWVPHQFGTVAIANGSITADKLESISMITNNLFANDITATNVLRSIDYARNDGAIYANAGMGIEFNVDDQGESQPRIATTNFAVTPGGALYARSGSIAGFKMQKGNSSVRTPPQSSIAFFDVDGNQSVEDEIIEVRNDSGGLIGYMLTANEDGTVVYTNIDKSTVKDGETYLLSQLWLRPQQTTESSDDSDDGYVSRLNARVIYLGSGNDLPHTTQWTGLQYYPESSPGSSSYKGRTFTLDKDWLDKCTGIRLEIDLDRGGSCIIQEWYGVQSSLYNGKSAGLGADDDGVYFGTDGVSVGEDILLTPDGHATVGELTVKDSAVIGGDIAFGKNYRGVRWTSIAGDHQIVMRTLGVAKDNTWGILVDNSPSGSNRALIINVADTSKSTFCGISERAKQDGNGNNIVNTYAVKSHNHDDTYLKLSGGSLTGDLTSGTTGDAANRNIIVQNSKHKGSMTTNYTSGRFGLYSNTCNKWIICCEADGTVTLNGNAATATKATQDASGNTITSTYMPLSTGRYVTGNTYSFNFECAGEITNNQKRIQFFVPSSRILSSGTPTCTSLSIVLRHADGGYPYARSGSSGDTYTRLGSGSISIWNSSKTVRTSEVANISCTRRVDGIIIAVEFTYALAKASGNETAVTDNAPIVAVANGSITFE